VPGHRRPGTVHPAGATVPRPGRAGFGRTDHDALPGCTDGPPARSGSRGGAMRLTVLGCAGSFPGPDAACSAYLVEADGFRLMLDFGTGSLSALQRYASLKAVDAILLTPLHAHPLLGG